jgi:hypothetical protein
MQGPGLTSGLVGAGIQPYGIIQHRIRRQDSPSIGSQMRPFMSILLPTPGLLGACSRARQRPGGTV